MDVKRRRSAIAALAIAAACGAGGAACGPSAEKLEGAAVLRAADALRDAPAEGAARRRELLTELERAPAASAPAARARDACVKAYRPLLDGTALEAKVRAAFSGSAAPTPADLGNLLEAEAKIKESAAAMPDCEAALADLRRWLR